MHSLVKLLNVQSGAKAVALLLIVTLLIFAFSTMSMSAPGVSLGDVNDDGEINVQDVVLVMQYVIGLRNLTNDQLEAADVNRDGRVNVQDATRIMRHVLGIEEIDELINQIVSVEDYKETVPYGTPVEQIDFPDSVKVTLFDDSEEEIDVEWEDRSTPAYRSLTAGDYTFKGDLVDLPAGVVNPRNIQAKAIITVAKLDIPAPTEPDPDQYTLTLVANPAAGGAVAISGTGLTSGNFEAGDLITVIAEAEPGYTFDEWTRNTTVVSNSTPYTFTMPAANITLVANFSLVPDVEITFEDAGGVVDDFGVPDVFNVYISLADAQDALGAGVTPDSTIILTVPGKAPIELTYFADQEAFFQASVQGYTENEINNALISLEGEAEPVTAAELNVGFGYPLVGHLTIFIDYEDAANGLEGITTNSVLILNVAGKENIELTYDPDVDQFIVYAIPGYEEAEIESALVTVQ